MATMGMYHVRWPAIKYGEKYAKKAIRLKRIDPGTKCEGIYNLYLDCIRQSKRSPGLIALQCSGFLETLNKCVRKTVR